MQAGQIIGGGESYEKGFYLLYHHNPGNAWFERCRRCLPGLPEWHTADGNPESQG
jgi:hypothetical protein